MAFSRDEARLVSSSGDPSTRVWDTASGECLEEIAGETDAAGVAAGRPRRAVAGRLETAIVETSGGVPIAWLPEALKLLATHWTARQWAGTSEGHAFLVALEGNVGC